MAKVVTVFTSEDADIQKAFTRMQQQMQKLQDQNKKLAQTSKEAAGQNNSMLDATAGKLAGLAASYGSVSTAINLATEALRRHQQIQKNAADSALSAAAAQAGLLRGVETKEHGLMNGRGGACRSALRAMRPGPGPPGRGRPAVRRRQRHRRGVRSRRRRRGGGDVPDGGALGPE